MTIPNSGSWTRWQLCLACCLWSALLDMDEENDKSYVHLLETTRQKRAHLTKGTSTGTDRRSNRKNDSVLRDKHVLINATVLHAPWKYNRKSQKSTSAELFSHTIGIVHFGTQVRTDKVAWQPRCQIQSAVPLGILRKRKVFHQVLKPGEQKENRGTSSSCSAHRSAAGTALRFTCLVGIISLKSSPGGQSFNFSTMGWPSSDLSRSARNKLTFHHVTLSHHSPLPSSSSKSFVPRRLTVHSKTDPDFPLGFQALS